MAEEKEKKPLTPEEMEQIKLKELVERFNLLTKDLFELGYMLQPYNQPGLRIVKMEKKSNLIPFNKGDFNPLKR